MFDVVSFPVPFSRASRTGREIPRDSSPAAVAAHPPGVVVEIVGTLMSDRGRSCEEHAVCGSVLEEDMEGAGFG